MDVARLVELNAAYARAIDNEQFEQWPKLFHDPCLYKLTTAENVAKGLESGIMYADSRAMLQDRVSALRKANIYESQRHRHLIGLPRVRTNNGESATVETGFAVLRIVRAGATEVFASGRYLDEVVHEDGACRLRRRDVVCDSSRVDTLLAIPL